MRPVDALAITLGLTLASPGLALAARAAAPPERAPARPRAPTVPAAPPWSARRPDVLRDVRAGRPLVVHVVVPLCNSALIDCGAAWAGRPGDLTRNLYWGALFGARRFLERRGSGWERVGLEEQAPARAGAVGERGAPASGAPALPAHALQRATYRRWEDGEAWGLERGRRVEVLVILEAVHGAHHDAAVERFFSLAAEPGTAVVGAEGGRREERVHVVGWAGHNRLMDGTPVPSARRPPPASAAGEGGEGPREGSAFVLACNSRAWFSEGLAARAARFVVGTRQLMAPEGYVLDAVLRGLGQNDTEPGLARRATDATARWQRVPRRLVAPIFAER